MSGAVGARARASRTHAPPQSLPNNTNTNKNTVQLPRLRVGHLPRCAQDARLGRGGSRRRRRRKRQWRWRRRQQQRRGGARRAGCVCRSRAAAGRQGCQTGGGERQRLKRTRSCKKTWQWVRDHDDERRRRRRRVERRRPPRAALLLSSLPPCAESPPQSDRPHPDTVALSTHARHQGPAAPRAVTPAAPTSTSFRHRDRNTKPRSLPTHRQPPLSHKEKPKPARAALQEPPTHSPPLTLDSPNDCGGQARTDPDRRRQIRQEIDGRRRSHDGHPYRCCRADGGGARREPAQPPAGRVRPRGHAAHGDLQRAHLGRQRPGPRDR
jgi:hypothetical protein